MSFKNKGKRIGIFLLVVLVAAIFLFSDEIKGLFEEKEDLQVISGTRETETTVPTQREQTEPQAQKQEKKLETTYWYWKGETYGAVTEEYLTLTKEGVYVLQVSLAGRNPEEGTGKYKRQEKDGEAIVRLYKDGGQIEGIMKADKLVFDDKTYEKTECEPL